MPMNERWQARLSSSFQVGRTVFGWAAPLIDVWTRLSLGEAFFVSGMLKLGNWPVALELAQHEYPVAWLDFHTAAALGAAIEVGGSILLVTGLLVRPAALAMLLLSLVIQLDYRQLDVNLFWMALFGWYVVHGPGPLSLDRLLAKGLKTSAVPLAAATINAASWLTRNGSPLYQLLVRLWLAATLLRLGSTAAIFPISTLGSNRAWYAVPLALMLAAGLGTRFIAGAAATVLAVLWAMSTGDDVTFYAPLLFAMVAAYGAGPWSLDQALVEALRRRMPKQSDADPHIIIVGAGFGGVACARALRHERVRVTLIDRRNYQLFQPLLYQVATANLSEADIATNIRSTFRAEPRLTVLCGTVSGVDPPQQRVTVDGREHRYDYLVLATGASHSYFGHDRWATYAPGLKSVDDAIAVRGRILTAFEQAEATDDPVERERLLTFVICGGGPTGVELAGAIAELAGHGLQDDFRKFDPASARIVLVQSGPRILPAFSETLSAFARASLERLGVEVRVGNRVEAIDETGAVVNGVRIPAATVLWAAGVVASPAARWLGEVGDNAGRVQVSSDLSVPAWPNVFAIGDTAASFAWNGMPVPGLAPAAKQAGAYVASVLSARVQASAPPPPFSYRHQGNLATIGRQSAVADFGWITLTGGLAWWVWGAIHIFFLVGLRNRMSVFLGWLWNYLTYRVGVQLITGEPQVPAESARQPQSRSPQKSGDR
jgi:NADH dehydrogenase/putative oxidoreductase